MPAVNPAVLRWARETAGLAEAEAADRLKIGAARGATPEERLRAIEAGEAEPSRSLLYKMAGLYRRPLVALYVAEPPTAAARIEDYRTLPDRAAGTEPLLQALVRDVRARQALVRTLMEDEEAPALAFVGSRRTAEGEDRVAEAMQRDLGFNLAAYRGAGGPDQAFAYLRGKAEAAGVFVLLIGDLGSHHTELDTESFRGFALADPLAPFVVLNDRDAHTAWSFTLLHELAHVWIGASGVSGARAEGQVERFCNEVAGRILFPPAELAAVALDPRANLALLAAQISALSAPRRLSHTMVAFRLFQAGRIPEARWNELRAHFRDEWFGARQRRRDERVGKAGGPDYYVVRRQRIGPGLIAFVDRMVREGALTPTKAGKVLGVRPRSVEPLLSGWAA